MDERENRFSLSARPKKKDEKDVNEPLTMSQWQCEVIAYFSLMEKCFSIQISTWINLSHPYDGFDRATYFNVAVVSVSSEVKESF